MATIDVKELLSSAPSFHDLCQNPRGAYAWGMDTPSKHIWYNYDREVDVLYLSFGEPRPADDSELTDDDLIIRYGNDEIIGVTILNASRRG